MNRVLLGVLVLLGLFVAVSCKQRQSETGLKAAESGDGPTVPLMRWHLSHPDALLNIRKTYEMREQQAVIRATVSLKGFGDSESLMTPQTHPQGLIHLPIDLDVTLNGGGSSSQSAAGYTGSGWVQVWGNAKVRKSIWLFPTGVVSTDAYFTDGPHVHEQHGSSASGGGILGLGLFRGLAARKAADATASAARQAYQLAYQGLSTQPTREMDKQVDPWIKEAHRIYREHDPMANLQKSYDVFFRSVPNEAMVCFYDKRQSRGQYQSCPKAMGAAGWSVQLDVRDSLLTQLAEDNLGGKTFNLEELRLQICRESLNFPVDFCNRSESKKELTRQLTLNDTKPMVASFENGEVRLTLDAFVKEVPFEQAIAEVAVVERLPTPDISAVAMTTSPDRDTVLALQDNAPHGKGFHAKLTVTYTVENGVKLKRRSITIDPKGLREPQDGSEAAFQIAAQKDLSDDEMDALFRDAGRGLRDVVNHVETQDREGGLSPNLRDVLGQLRQMQGEGSVSEMFVKGLVALKEFHNVMEELKSVFAEEIHGPSLPLFVTQGVHKLASWNMQDGSMAASWKACKRERLGLGIDLGVVPATGRPNYKFIKVLKVHPNTPAAEAGLKANDFIYEVEGMHYGTTLAFQYGINDLSTRAGDRPIMIKLQRYQNGAHEKLEVPVTLRTICPGR